MLSEASFFLCGNDVIKYDNTYKKLYSKAFKPSDVKLELHLVEHISSPRFTIYFNTIKPNIKLDRCITLKIHVLFL